MGKFKGTPGPWVSVNYAGFIKIHSKPYYGEPDLLDEEQCNEAQINAHLIASAPDLLEALQALLIETGGACDPNIFRKAKKAIDKALGKESEVSND